MQSSKLTGMTVALDVLSEDNYYQKAAVELSSGTGNYDGLMVGNLQAGQYTAAGWLAPLDELLGKSSVIDARWYNIDDIFASGRAAGSYKDQLMALPIATEAEVVIYRKSLYEKAGIGPVRTFDDLINAAAATKDGNISGIVDEVGAASTSLGLDGLSPRRRRRLLRRWRSALNTDAARQASGILHQQVAEGARTAGHRQHVLARGIDCLQGRQRGNVHGCQRPARGRARQDHQSRRRRRRGLRMAVNGFERTGTQLLVLVAGHAGCQPQPRGCVAVHRLGPSPEVSLAVGRASGSPVARASVWADEGFKKFFPGDTAAEISKSLATVQPTRVPIPTPNSRRSWTLSRSSS